MRHGTCTYDLAVRQVTSVDLFDMSEWWLALVPSHRIKCVDVHTVSSCIALVSAVSPSVTARTCRFAFTGQIEVVGALIKSEGNISTRSKGQY